MQIHTLKRNTVNKTKKRVGRGGKRGKTSGRGTKGQKARAGHRMYPEIRDMIKKIPKRRGYGKNRSHTVDNGRAVTTVLNVGLLEKHYVSGDSVNPMTLIEKKLITRKGGKLLPIKILGTGPFSKKVSVSGCQVSASARLLIEKNGGSIAS